MARNSTPASVFVWLGTVALGLVLLGVAVHAGMCFDAPDKRADPCLAGPIGKDSDLGVAFLIMAACFYALAAVTTLRDRARAPVTPAPSPPLRPEPPRKRSGVPSPLHWAAIAMADADLAHEQHERAPGWTPQGRADRYAVLVGARKAYHDALHAAASPRVEGRRDAER